MAVTSNQIIKRRETKRVNYPAAASTTIYEGTLVFTVPGSGFADDDTGAGVNALAGIAVEKVDNSGGSAGDLNVEVYQEGIFELVGSSFVQADVGADVFATDNFTITKTRTATSVHVGKIVEFISATKVMVDIKAKGDPNTAIAAASVAHALNASFSDTEVEAALDALGVKINSVIDALEVKGILEPN